MLNWVISVLSFCLIVGGNFPDAVGPCRVVTEITVEWSTDDTQGTVVYTDQHKMNKVLNYIRSLDPMPVSGDALPNLEGKSRYQIGILRSDGTIVSYTQYGITNFRKENGTLNEVDPEDAIRLPLLLAAVPGDGS